VNDSLAIAALLSLTAFSVLVAAPLMRPRGAQLRRYRVPLGLLLLQISMAPVAWLLVWAAPDEETFDGTICPDIASGSAREAVLVALFFGSWVVGGLAVAAAYAVYRPRLTRPALFAVATLAAPFGIVVAAVYDALCGTS
jgi:hypothetical protein